MITLPADTGRSWWLSLPRPRTGPGWSYLKYYQKFCRNIFRKFRPGQGSVQGPVWATVRISWVDWKLRPGYIPVKSGKIFLQLTLSPDQSAGRLLQLTQTLVSLPISPAYSAWQNTKLNGSSWLILSNWSNQAPRLGSRFI